jgi:hypothetical protein
MTTLKVSIENETYAMMFAELIANFPFVKSVEIPTLTKTFHGLYDDSVETLVLPPQKIGDPSKYCGIWANKEITDVKQFRSKLWQRNP